MADQAVESAIPHYTTIERVQIENPRTPSGRGWAWTWVCHTCGARGRRTWDYDDARSWPDRFGSGFPSQRRARFSSSALEAGLDHERNARIPNRGHRLALIPAPSPAPAPA